MDMKRFDLVKERRARKCEWWMDTSNVYGDNRRTWNSLIYSRFLVIGFDKSVDTYTNPFLRKSLDEKKIKENAYQKQHQ